MPYITSPLAARSSVLIVRNGSVSSTALMDIIQVQHDAAFWAKLFLLGSQPIDYRIESPFKVPARLQLW